MKVKDCVSNINDFSGFCEVVNNVTLRKNLVNYFMQTEIRKRTDKKNLVEIAVPDQLEYQIQYDQLSNVKNSSAVRTYFGEDFVKTYLVEGSEAMGPQIRFGDLLILLPTPAEYSMDHIYYNNSMKKLLELRASLAMAQAKIKSTPEDVTKLDLILRGILQ